MIAKMRKGVPGAGNKHKRNKVGDCRESINIGVRTYI